MFYRAKLMSIRNILKDNDLKHFIEAVSYSSAVLFTDLFGVKVGCHDGELLVEVAVFEQVNQRICDIAVVQHLCRLFAEVVDGKQPFRA